MSSNAIAKLGNELDRLAISERELEAKEAAQINEKQTKICDTLIEQVERFIVNRVKAPYCVLDDIIGPYYRITGEIAGVKTLLTEINGKFRVLFLGQSEETNSTKLHVLKVALLINSAKEGLVEAQWGSEYKGTAYPKVVGITHLCVFTFADIGNEVKLYF